jgi:hypothetical protein
MRNPFKGWGAGPTIEHIDWPGKCARLEVRLAMALGFLRTIPGEEVPPEEAASWHLRLDRFLTMDVQQLDDPRRRE